MGESGGVTMAMIAIIISAAVILIVGLTGLVAYARR